MPRYSWLLTQKLDTSSLPARIGALRKVGVPYPPGYELKALDELKAQSGRVVTNLQSGMVKAKRTGKSSRSSPICNGSAPTSKPCLLRRRQRRRPRS